MSSASPTRAPARGPAFGANGMVASSQAAATVVGIDILRAGGSAVDAAIATNAALSVIEPHMCGLGGDLFALVWDPSEQGLIGLNASGKSPAELSYDAMKSLCTDGDVPLRGPLSLTVPGAVDGWCMLHDSYGKLSLADVLRPARALAEQGAAIGEKTAGAWQGALAGLQADRDLDGLLEPYLDTFSRGGAAPISGEIHRNPDLANTFQIVGEGGSAAFYEGEIAERLIPYLKKVGAHLTQEDFANNRAEWVQAISTSYRGVEIFELPPNGQGMSVLQMLNILEGFPLDEYSRDDARYWHAFLEAKKLAFEDRAKHYADPKTYDAPLSKLVDKHYAQQRRDLIDPERAGVDYQAGNFAVPGSDTTYLTAADSDGLMVSLIQSIFSPFGSGLVPPGLGFALQSRGAGFSLDSEHANCYQPNKRPFHTIIPAFACKGGQPWFSFGVMGADMQPQGQVQILNNMLDFGMNPQQAGDAPRMRHDGGRQPNGRHLDGLGITQYEEGIDPKIVESLAGMGHKMMPQQPGMGGFTGGYQGIMRDLQAGIYVGATESRLDGLVLGI